MQQQLENEQMQYEETAKQVYENLSSIDASKYLDKKNGLSYVSWANALHLALSEYPTMTWDIREWNGLPYCKTECGYFVEVSVTIEGLKRSCKLPVIDYRNKTIAQPNAFQINTSHQRALTKCLGLHGMALYIYAGEDLPFAHDEETQQPIEPAIDCNEIADKTLSALVTNDYYAIGEIWSELTEFEQKTLWVAKSKGGYFTQAEKNSIREAISAYKSTLSEQRAEDYIND